MIRRHGRLQPLESVPIIADEIQRHLTTLCSAEQANKFAADKNIDFSLELPWDDQVQRFRVNLFRTRGEVAACFRIIPGQIPSFEWAGFPEELARRLTRFRNGLVLITGVAGSGKSTTLAMLINQLIHAGGCRIITVEEPVEYPFTPAENSLVTQREVGQDVASFADGLKYGLRQDPDVILVGEIRDRETAQMALSAAETGHLVFSTLHTRDAKGAISRYADLFPQDTQGDVRAQLALGLRAVISQHLMPGYDPTEKRKLALEIMFNNHAISSAIRFGKLESIDNCILTGRAEGMLTLDESIRRLYQAGEITNETALRFVSSPTVLSRSR